jgi:Ca2+-binding RTX toxin-like protein
MNTAIVTAKTIRKATIDGGGGNDTITGSSGEEVLRGNVGSDILSGLGGRDALFGGDGNDSLFGGRGIDFFDGGNGNDFLDASDGQAGETVLGGSGHRLRQARQGRRGNGRGNACLTRSYRSLTHAKISAYAGRSVYSLTSYRYRVW